MRLSRIIRSVTASFAGFPSNSTWFTASTMGMGTLYFTNEDPGPAVPAVHTGAGHDQVSDACKPGKGLEAASHGHPQTADLCNAAGDQGSLCIIPVPQAVGSSRRQGHHIL